jgi:hypothetical protein
MLTWRGLSWGCWFLIGLGARSACQPETPSPAASWAGAGDANDTASALVATSTALQICVPAFLLRISGTLQVVTVSTHGVYQIGEV